jgi:hypothetical protein
MEQGTGAQRHESESLMPKPSTATIARKLLAARDRGKAAYAEADTHLDALIEAVKVGERIDLGNNEYAEIVDAFASKNVVWKPAGVRRFDIKTSHE